MTIPDDVAEDQTSKIPDDAREDQTSKTLWHRILGQVLEESLTRVGIFVQTEVEVVSESPKADIILLRREGVVWTDEQKVWLADGVRDTTANHILIEFKFSESLTEDAVEQTFVYGYLYRKKQKLHRGELQSFLLVAKTPNTDILARFGYEQTEQPGVWRSSLPLIESVGVILLNQLTDEPHNAVWKCFASREKEWQKALVSLDRHGLSTLSLKFKWMTLELRRLRMKEAKEDLDLAESGKQWFDSIMESFSREEFLKINRVGEIWREGVLDGEKTGKKTGQKIGEKTGEAKILVRQLTRRFGELSSWVRETIMAADQATLEKWSDLVLDARSLEDVIGPNRPNH